ncbi:MAG TPA: sigma-70 family RNA polymerase sigma factor [Streptosporangiaceae bacterium]|jgi:RNA polymerase sigma-70 factor (ECF subfamily)
MPDSDVLAAAFEEHRPRLRSVAYRLLGSMTDADDAVQDAWLRLTGTDSEVENLAGWLTTVVARISLNMLRSRRNRHEEPVGDTWPGAAEEAARDGVATRPAAQRPDPEDEVLLADSVGVALLVVLDALTPAERLSFVLHDMFAMPFDEIAPVLGRSPEATRQLASRARRRVRGTPTLDHAPDLARQREVTAAFLAAARGGDLAALVALLDDEVTLTGDAYATPAHRPAALRGAELVAKGAISSASRAKHSQLALVDGSVAIVYAPAGRLQIVLSLTVSPSGKVTAINVTGDPELLAQKRLAMLPD